MMQPHYRSTIKHDEQQHDLNRGSNDYRGGDVLAEEPYAHVLVVPKGEAGSGCYRSL